MMLASWSCPHRVSGERRLLADSVQAINFILVRIHDEFSSLMLSNCSEQNMLLRKWLGGAAAQPITDCGAVHDAAP
jgi:hypothetical protein